MIERHARPPAGGNPVTKRGEPKVKPAEPGAKRAEPEAKPVEPGAKRAEPEAKPVVPELKPGVPEAKRAEPVRPQPGAERQHVRDAATRLFASQEVRWGLQCEVVDWAIEGPAIAALRARVYSEKLPHMIAGGEPVDEADARAHHFVARRDGVIVAAMRLLPLPFEAEALFPNLREQHLRADTQYVEIGRMVVAPGTADVGASRLLSLFGLVWGLTHTDYDGLVAYARERTVNHFRMLGLEVVERIAWVPAKADQAYVLMVAHRENTLNHLNALGL